MSIVERLLGIQHIVSGGRSSLGKFKNGCEEYVTGDHDFSWIQVFCEIGIGYLTRYMVNYLLQCFQLYLRTPLGLSGAAQPDC